MEAVVEIEAVLARIREQFGADRFTSGSCHDLAAALHDAFGGTLAACIRIETDEDGEEFSRTYSHMVWSPSESNVCFDIFGDKADNRWVEQWRNEPDEDGLSSTFDWVEIERSNLVQWVTSSFSFSDDELIDSLRRSIAGEIIRQPPRPKRRGLSYESSESFRLSRPRGI